uniref:Uncharacterized protein n=1 Tax=Rhodosorus marinus TaxID=101924 RepID=A0A7S2ZYQ9_9RHOD|mmetsp:Transcript_37856/g.150773  ORF Transcript_37856/g.150773 Transcript_37856/m.150773 type:complete len:153 (+) Transcript_37856:222-680(+)|eukprot:CAMPEP_0113969754 /NCGR_PEP_ID=MMETSP0011_2-20120614/10569_1 /TAXON_ID=101924 /ORGANISM="Rhodosorus marinus" /LENGTH=152 /DNA_ID=CAMNT_0000983599 /DNA_START=160 /DNA_END=618 /DNA_ORIENTATION=+ /assembly_acc=CAM_ASM_000156
MIVTRNESIVMMQEREWDFELIMEGENSDQEERDEFEDSEEVRLRRMRAQMRMAKEKANAQKKRMRLKRQIQRRVRMANAELEETRTRIEKGRESFVSLTEALSLEGSLYDASSFNSELLLPRFAFLSGEILTDSPTSKRVTFNTELEVFTD